MMEKRGKTASRPSVSSSIEAGHVPPTDNTRAARRNVWVDFMTYLHWYSADQTEEEKRLILKLDLSILVFGCLSFFTKYLDQQSITNAYVRCAPKLPMEMLKYLPWIDG